MSEPDRRRPLPALIFILALTLLTALVWFRVLHRGGGDARGATSTSTTPCPTSSAAPPATSGHRHTLPPPKSVRVLVLNATNRSGLAGRTTKALRKDGFRTATPADDQSRYGGHGVGQIRFGSGAKQAAKLVGYFIPGAKLVPMRTGSATVTIALGAKFKAPASRKRVLARLHRKHITVTTKAAPQPAPASPTC